MPWPVPLTIIPFFYLDHLSPVGILVQVVAVHHVDELADEGAHVEGGVVGAEEVLTNAVQTVVVHLEHSGVLATVSGYC